jgi:hypothetical protein
MKRLTLLTISLYFLLFTFYFSTLEATDIKIKSTKEGGFKLLVDKKPFLVKGLVYHPIPLGKDYNYNFWTDLNQVDRDAKLMKKAGFNAVRFYRSGDNLEQTRKVIRKLHENGIYTVMGHWLGFWNYPCPFYGDKKFEKRIKREVVEMVKGLKDEDGLLMWILGNENNYSFSGKVNPWTCAQVERIEDPALKVSKKAEVYYRFVNKVTKAIKRIDKKHPVAMGNGELITIDIASKYAKDIDILALIFYRGKRFGNIFDFVRENFANPVLIAGVGCDAYDGYRNKENQDIQAECLLSQWIDLYKNTSFFKDNGNCLGGIIFEWNDEWWKYSPSDPSRWSYHDTAGGWSNGSYYFDIKAPRNLNMNEEWFGIVSYEKDQDGNFIKKPRKVYYALKEFFKNPKSFVADE